MVQDRSILAHYRLVHSHLHLAVTLNATTTFYEAMPLRPTPQIISRVLRQLLRFDSVFTDFNAPACTAGCASSTEPPCASCASKMQIASWTLAAPDSRSWEVWKTEEDASTLVGLITFTRIQHGKDALAHYVFFDNDLRGKTTVLRDVLAWAFENHPEDGWQALRRLTIEIPTPFFALANHASRYLGFNGPFEHTVTTARGRRKQLKVEGIKRNSVMWRGEPVDVLVLSTLNHKS